jgi:hypothetical protein
MQQFGSGQSVSVCVPLGTAAHSGRRREKAEIRSHCGKKGRPFLVEGSVSWSPSSDSARTASKEEALHPSLLSIFVALFSIFKSGETVTKKNVVDLDVLLGKSNRVLISSQKETSIECE